MAIRVTSMSGRDGERLLQRFKRHKLAAIEDRKLLRQRELRRLLGIDEANVPRMVAIVPEPSPT